MSTELDALLAQSELNLDYYRQEAESSSESSFHNMVTGTNYLRVLPAWARGMFAKRVYRHYSVPIELVPSEGNQEIQTKSFLCMQTHGAVCAICGVLREFENLTERVSDYGATDSYYVNALVFDTKGNIMYNGMPKVVKISWGVYTWIRSEITNPKIGNILHAITGSDIQVDKLLKSGRTSYTCKRLKENRIAPTDQEVVTILKSLTDLDKMFPIPANAADVLVETSNTLRSFLEGVVAAGSTETQLPGEHSMDGTSNRASSTTAPVAAPVVTAPVVTAPVVTAPVAAPVAAPVVTAPVVTAPVVTAPVVTAPVAAPEGAPPCYGTYHHPFNKETNVGYNFRKCIPCKLEPLCKASSVKP